MLEQRLAAMQFAAELTKNQVAQKKAEEQKVYQVKMARCFGLANEELLRGMIKNASEVPERANEMMGYTDDAFGLWERQVKRQPLLLTTKQASADPPGMPLFSGMTSFASVSGAQSAGEVPTIEQILGERWGSRSFKG